MNGMGDDREPTVPGVGGAGVAPETGVRFVLLGVVFALGFLILAGRALYLGADGAGVGAVPGVNVAVSAEPVRRGDLLDRNGEILATSLTSYILVAVTGDVWDPADTAAALGRVIPDLDRSLTQERLSREGQYVWLARGLTPQERDGVFSLGLPGIVFETEARRVYPRGRFGAHVLGFSLADGTGGAGAEYALNDTLAAGQSVALTLDVRVQIALESELRAAMSRHGAQAAAGVVMHAQTGEIFALASLPDFDPNAGRPDDGDVRLNRAVGGVFELGSVFKALTYAIALDSGAVDDTTVLSTQPLALPGGDVSDYAPSDGPLRPREALAVSSNTAAARAALLVDVDVYRSYLRALGLAPGDALFGAGPDAAGVLWPGQWGVSERATVAYGHGISVSPVAFAGAFASVVNGGMPVEARVYGPSEVDGSRVFSPNTSATMRAWLGAVVTQGTGQRAQVGGYGVIGKTGTAEKPVAGGYDEDRKITSFAAAFPGDAPEYVVFIMLDEPQWGARREDRAVAGNTAAPTAGAVIARAGPILGVLPDRDGASGGSVAGFQDGAE